MGDKNKDKKEEENYENFQWGMRILDARTDAMKMAVELHTHKDFISLKEILNDAEKIVKFIIK